MSRGHPHAARCYSSVSSPNVAQAMSTPPPNGRPPILVAHWRSTRNTRVVRRIATSRLIGNRARRSRSACGVRRRGGTNPSDPHVAMGAHLFVQFGCSACHGEQGKGGVSPDVPALTASANTADVAQMTDDHQQRAGRVGEPAEAVHAGLGAGHLEEPGERPRRVHPAGLPKVKDATPVTVPSGQGAAVAGAALYVRRGASTATAPTALAASPTRVRGQDDPAALGAGLPHRVQHRREDQGDDPLWQRIGKPPIASMPHWGGILSDEHLTRSSPT